MNTFPNSMTTLKPFLTLISCECVKPVFPFPNYQCNAYVTTQAKTAAGGNIKSSIHLLNCEWSEFFTFNLNLKLQFYAESSFSLPLILLGL